MPTRTYTMTGLVQKTIHWLLLVGNMVIFVLFVFASPEPVLNHVARLVNVLALCSVSAALGVLYMKGARHE